MGNVTSYSVSVPVSFATPDQCGHAGPAPASRWDLGEQHEGPAGTVGCRRKAEPFYRSLQPRVCMVSGQPLGLLHRYKNFTFTGLLGARF